MDLESLLRKSVRSKGRQRMAVLFTGGLDSTALAVAFRKEKPLLVFGALDTPHSADYNRDSIVQCRRVAAALNLPFKTIRITPEMYARHFYRCLLISGLQSFDNDLPAACVLFKKMEALDIACVVSGMGSNEAFARTPPQYLARSLASHQQLARKFGVAFRAPYLSPSVLQYVTSLPSATRKNRAPLREILKKHAPVFQLLRKRPGAHSSVPKSFYPPLRALKRYASVQESASKGPADRR